MSESFHYTVEEIMAMPGYCRDRYERRIKHLEETNAMLVKSVFALKHELDKSKSITEESKRQ